MTGVDEGRFRPGVAAPSARFRIGFLGGTDMTIGPLACGAVFKANDFEVREVGVAVFDPGALDEAPRAGAGEELVGVAAACEGEGEGASHGQSPKNEDWWRVPRMARSMQGRQA